MDEIPQELLLEIFDHLGKYPKDLLPYVTVCRRWQITIERLTFRKLTVSSKTIDRFSSLFRPEQPHRKGFVRWLTLYVHLPVCEGCTRDNRKSRAISDSVHRLFRVLETFNEDEDVRSHDQMSLSIFSIRSRNPCWDGRNLPWRVVEEVHLLDLERLPTLSFVSNFHYYPHNQVLGMMIASKLKSECFKGCSLRSNGECLNEEAQVISRHAFPRGFDALKTPITWFDLKLYDLTPKDHSKTPLSLIPSGPNIDPFTAGLHKLIIRCNVKTLSLQGMLLSPEFFWPINESPTILTGLWSKMEFLWIEPAFISPKGDWYFLHDPAVASYAQFTGQGSSRSTKRLLGLGVKPEDNEFRTLPDAEKIDPLLTAMAHAVGHAPSLKHMSVKWVLSSDPKYVDTHCLLQFEIEYLAAGFNKRAFDYRPYRHIAPFYYNRLMISTKHWRLSEKVERHWRDALGPNGIILYKKFEQPEWY